MWSALGTARTSATSATSATTTADGRLSELRSRRRLLSAEVQRRRSALQRRRQEAGALHRQAEERDGSASAVALRHAQQRRLGLLMQAFSTRLSLSRQHLQDLVGRIRLLSGTPVPAVSAGASGGPHATNRPDRDAMAVFHQALNAVGTQLRAHGMDCGVGDGGGDGGDDGGGDGDGGGAGGDGGGGGDDDGGAERAWAQVELAYSTLRPPRLLVRALEAEVDTLGPRGGWW
ncbi:uncharacterized protein LOC144952342 [Lampetra fluviatilis]